MNAPRKKPAVRLFSGLVGRLPFEENPKLEIVPAAAPAPPSPQSIAALEQEILTAKKKRGRPRLHLDNAEKQRVHRKTKKDIAKQKAIQDEIDAILKIKPENNDQRGKIHGESSGGDVVGRVENAVERGVILHDGRRAPRLGTDPRAFEDGLTQKETDETWVNRQNFNTPSKWDKWDKEIFTLRLADLVCVRGDSPRCRLCDFASGWFQDVRAHFIETHRDFIRGEIKRHKPKPEKLAKKPEENIVTEPQNG